MGLSFQVNDQVLIPRQDTETLVEEILKDCQNRDVEILDLCTGSGCIGLSLAVLGRYRSVSAADISEGALKIALKNARNLFMIQKNVIRSQSKKVSDQPWRMELSVWTGEAEKGRNGAGIFGNRPGTGRPLEVEERSFSLFQSDLFSADDGRLYDVIVSNPLHSVGGCGQPGTRGAGTRAVRLDWLDGLEATACIFTGVWQKSADAI